MTFPEELTEENFKLEAHFYWVPIVAVYSVNFLLYLWA